MKHKISWSTVKYWIALNVGILMMAFGIYFFKAPNNFATGGVSGLAIILCKFTKDIPWLGQTELTAYMNVFLLIIGFIFLGKGCSLKTAYCTLVYSGEMQLMKLICTKVITLPLPLTNQPFLEFVFAMLLTGAGSAIIFNCKASSGGTDILALIVKKYTPLKDVGKALILTDFVIACSAFFVFDGYEAGLYSVLGLFTKAFLIDGVIESIVKSKYVMIITPHPEAVAPFILEGLHRSFTSFKAQGGYTGEERTVLVTVCRKMEAYKLKMKLHNVDPDAFVILCDTSEIMGRGWGTL